MGSHKYGPLVKSLQVILLKKVGIEGRSELNITIVIVHLFIHLICQIRQGDTKRHSLYKSASHNKHTQYNTQNTVKIQLQENTKHKTDDNNEKTLQI